MSGTPFFLERCSTFHAPLSRRAVNRVLLLHLPLQRRAFASRAPSAGCAVPNGDSREYGSERSCVLDCGRARSPDPPRLALRRHSRGLQALPWCGVVPLVAVCLLLPAAVAARRIESLRFVSMAALIVSLVFLGFMVVVAAHAPAVRCARRFVAFMDLVQRILI